MYHDGLNSQPRLRHWGKDFPECGVMRAKEPAAKAKNANINIDIVHT